MFFERSAEAPAETATAEEKPPSITQEPIADLGPEQAYNAAVNRDTIDAYEEFIAAYRESLGKTGASTRRRAARSGHLATDPDERHTGGLLVLSQALSQGSATLPIAAAVSTICRPSSRHRRRSTRSSMTPPPPPEEIFYVEQPVIVFDDPVFAFVPPPPPPVLVAAGADLYRRAAATAAADRSIRITCSSIRSDPRLCSSASLCDSAASEHLLREHPQ